MINGRLCVDTFIFNNELDILEIRMNEMDSFVDWFVLVEGTKSFANQPKELNYLANKHRFEKFHRKLIHVIVDDMPNTPDPWALEAFTRNATLRGVKQVPGLVPADWIILSDVDEIMRAETMMALNPVDWHVYKLDLTFRYYKFNCKAASDGWSAPIMVNAKFFTDPQNTRHNNNPEIPWDKLQYVKGAGWHFSYMGGVDAIISKIQMNAHQELNTDHFKSAERLKLKIHHGEDLYDRKDQNWEFVRNTYYPKFVLDNPEKFKEYFEPMQEYKFRCVIPFSGNYESLRWAVESCYIEVSKFSTVLKPVVVVNNSGQSFDHSKLVGLNYELFDIGEPLLLPNTLNWAIRTAKTRGDDFMMWMHDDAALRTNAVKILMDKYEAVKGQRWGTIFLGKDGDTCSLYNPSFNFNENVWYDPFLFPMYFMDCHYFRILRLRGWTLEYANWEGEFDYVIHKQSHSLEDVPTLRRRNDLIQDGQRALYRAIWGGDPGQETNNDPHAGGTV